MWSNPSFSATENPKRKFRVFLFQYFPNFNIIHYLCGDFDVVLHQKCGDLFKQHKFSSNEFKTY